MNELKVRRTCTKMKRALERNQNAGKCKGRTRREPEDGKEMKGAETEMKRKEVKGNARKLSDMQGRHAAEVKFKSGN